MKKRIKRDSQARLTSNKKLYAPTTATKKSATKRDSQTRLTSNNVSSCKDLEYGQLLCFPDGSRRVSDSTPTSPDVYRLERDKITHDSLAHGFLPCEPHDARRASHVKADLANLPRNRKRMDGGPPNDQTREANLAILPQKRKRTDDATPNDQAS